MKDTSNNVSIKILKSLFLLLCYRYGNTLPLWNIDQQQLIASSKSVNSITEFVQIYSGESNLITFFSLGIMPYINASIIIDALTVSIPALEKLQSEEGLKGKNKLYFYKKILTVVFSFFQSYFLVNSINGYLYDTSFSAVTLTQLLLITGALVSLWMCNILESIGLISNGSSLIILSNIITSFFGKVDLKAIQPLSIFTILFIIYLIILINFSQMASYEMPIISARQLDYLEKENNQLERKTTVFTKLSIKFNQSGVFPLIVAANVIAFLSSGKFPFFFSNKIFQSIAYFSLIVGANYFYTTVLWDPEKVSEQLRKASVSILNKNPGKETTNYLSKVVKFVSIRGGILLAYILLSYEIAKILTQSPLLEQVNISSLIVTIGIVNEISKNLQAFGVFNLYKKNEIKKETYESTTIGKTYL
jgi:preprotein translocase subunit SecY